MKATDFYLNTLIFDHFPQSWKIIEVINFGRAKDKDFYPVSKKGTEVQVTVMHAANLLFALATGTTKANIEKTLKMRLILRSQKGTYFMNDLAELLKDPDNFIPSKWNPGPAKKGVKEIRISTARAYAEIVFVNQSDYPEGLSDMEPTEIVSIVEGVDVYSGGNFSREKVEDMAIISHEFLAQYSEILNDPTGLTNSEHKIQIHSYKRIESL